MTPARAFGFARALWRAYGLRGSVERVLFELRKRLGRYRAAPRPVASAAEQSPLPAPWPFVPDAEGVRRSTDTAVAIERANRVLRGEQHAYRWTWTPRPTTPQGWRMHPVTGFEYAAAKPWYTVAHYDRAAGDVKDVWEPARFGWAYDLMRGWMLTGDDAYARAFWTGVETFLDGNPPYNGVHWSCGQETTIRAVAWLWAEAVFAGAPSTTPDRLARLRRALVWSAERVEDAIGYAVVQRNNHGVSETVGLTVLGARFLGSEPRAEGWLERGQALLEDQVLDQFLPDGWYLQHSFNYARLALEQVVVGQRALTARGRSLSPAACARIAAAVKLIVDLMEPTTGTLPNHGPNDGAYVLPLSTAGYRDYRPAITAAVAVCGAALPEGIEPNREVLAWLGSPPPAVAPRGTVPFVRTGESGWALGRTSSVMLFARAGRYRSRPSHIDPLHVDLWIAGQPVAIDAGTYRYWASPPWANGMVEAENHNTITIEGLPVAMRGPRYLWLRWPDARVESAETDGRESFRIELVNESWRDQGVEHRRVCEVSGGVVTITDDIRAPSTLAARVTAHWLIDGDPGVLTVTGSKPVAIELLPGRAQSVFGWIAEGYGEKRAVTSVRAVSRLENGHLRLTSSFDISAIAPANAVEERETTAVGGAQ